MLLLLLLPLLMVLPGDSVSCCSIHIGHQQHVVDDTAVSLLRARLRLSCSMLPAAALWHCSLMVSARAHQNAPLA